MLPATSFSTWRNAGLGEVHSERRNTGYLISEEADSQRQHAERQNTEYLISYMQEAHAERQNRDYLKSEEADFQRQIGEHLM